MSGFPELIRPMLATAGELPIAHGWSYEFKWDGVRAITYVRGGQVRVVTRNDRVVTGTYPELRVLGELLGSRAAVLDGEIVALDDEGRPNFGTLQSRMHVARPGEELLRRVPVAYFAFDLLHLGSESLLGAGYSRRRQLLDELGLEGRPEVRLPPCFVDGDGPHVLKAAGANGVEGVVAKRTESRYEPGRRSRSWIKVPLVRTQEVVIGGWQPGEGRRAGTVGSLLLGVPSSNGLHYAGKVGTGFTETMLRDLAERLASIEQSGSPFGDAVPRDHARGARWVRPVLVGEVEYRQWTGEGRLRHASWRGLRPDKDPDDVTGSSPSA